MGKQHKIGAQADGIDNVDIIEDVWLKTDNSLLFILQEVVAADPDNEGIQVGMTFWRLPGALYLDRNICFVRKDQKAVWPIPFGNSKTSKLES